MNDSSLLPRENALNNPAFWTVPDLPDHPDFLKFIEGNVTRFL